ncbi:hypothetical protein [Ktedonosporobacter rubrisoli]|nr:hypothetical protein [Ktedonosporobacter rubrisoli]
MQAHKANVTLFERFERFAEILEQAPGQSSCLAHTPPAGLCTEQPAT